MKFLNFFFVVCSVTFLAGPVTVPAAVVRLPIGSAEVILEDVRSRVDDIHIIISGERPDGRFMGDMYNKLVFSHTLPDGREESIGELARRSLTELETFIGEEIKKGVEKSITTADNAQKLVGNYLVATYDLFSPFIQWDPWKGGHILIRGGNSSDVLQSPPKSGDTSPKLYSVKLVESIKQIADRQTYPLTVPGIARAQITEEDENGNTIRTADSVKATLIDIFRTVNGAVDYPLVYHEDDTLFVPLFFVLSGKGTLRIWYRDGSEQVFRRQDGAGLITYLSSQAVLPGDMAFAALKRLPIGSAEALVEDARNRVNSVYISVDPIIGVKVSDSVEYTGTGYDKEVLSYTLPDGRKESIGELARRSLTELEAFIGMEIKKGVEAIIKANASKLVGYRLSASYGLFVPITRESPRKGEYGLITDDYLSEVFQSPPQTIDSVEFKRFRWTASLTESLKGMTNSYEQTYYPLAVPGVTRAQITEEDENGNTIRTTDSIRVTPNDYDARIVSGVPRTRISQEGDTLLVPLFFALSGKGTLRIWYRDGSEQVFRLSNGESITYLVTFLGRKRLGVPRVTASGVKLLYEATDDEQVLIKHASPDFKTWEPLPYLPIYPPIAPAGARPALGSLPVRIRTATAPLNSTSGFYKAEVVSPVVPQLPQRP